MKLHKFIAGLALAVLATVSGLAAPVIDPIGNVTIPAGKSLIIPITATSPSGFPLTYTIQSSTNAFAVVMHTNNPFWQLSVAQAASASAPGAYQTPYRGGLVTVTNVGTLTFMLFPEYAPHTVNVFQGLTESGFYNSNTIFHRVVSGFVIQGGDPDTNGSGGLVATYDDEYNPQAMYTGNGQLGLANSGKDTDSSQFFVTVGAQRYLDFAYPLFGQLVRGFPVLTNIISTAVNTNDRPEADEVIQLASYVTNTTDTVLTLTATNVSGVTGTITVIASDGTGGLATNQFTATTMKDTNSYNQAFLYSNTVTNLVAPVNTTLTNFIPAVQLDGEELYWFPSFETASEETNGAGSTLTYSNTHLRTLTYNVTNVDGGIKLYMKPYHNFTGTLTLYVDVSSYADWQELESEYPYDQQSYSFVYGDTPISGQSNVLAALAAVPFTNLVLATFTNGVPGSAATNFTAFINWGDNTTNSGTVTASADGQKAVLGSHTYAYPGAYPVYLQAQSALGASATILTTVVAASSTAPETSSLTVRTNGAGTVSPGYLDAPLTVGESYSLSASPANGWLFLNWTDENGFVLGTGPNLTFTMSPGLSLYANFEPPAAPTVAFATPSTGQVITNLFSTPLVTVTGTAADNATVVSVWYQVNGGGWQAASGTANWTASFTPVSGVSNVIQAYAINNFGIDSATNTLQVKYLSGAVLSLSTNGLGSITPGLNNDLLPLGSNYVLTAAPASGFAFVSWTGSVTTNKATVKFTMTTNLSLTANFADKTKPTVAITNLVTGEKVSTSSYTVKGTAKDNWLLNEVLYQLNNSGWNTATGTTNWSSAALNLVPGTNVFRVYAVDGNGTTSLTNTVIVDYVVSAQLQLMTTGLGTITPNESNAWLAVGQSYTLTAKPATGFGFTGWTGSVTTNSASLYFTMASNLSFTANFKDITAPTLTITNLVKNQRVTNSTFAVGGKASDNWQLAGVEYQLNSGGWYGALGASNWSATLDLQPGTNVLQAFAIDTTGNHSLTNTLVFDYVVTAQLQLMTSGSGTISPNYSNQWLAVGQNYTMKATPAKGWVFYDWLNGNLSALTNSATVTFTMSEGLALTANFHQPVTIETQPENVLAFDGGSASFTVVAGGTGPLAYQWQFDSANLPGQNAATLDLSSLTTANAGSYRVIVNSYSESVTSSVAKLTLTNAPTSLSGLDLIVTPAGDTSFQLSFGPAIFSQFSPDTNYDSAAGTYDYLASGGLSGELSLTNAVPSDSAGTRVADLTFVSPGWAVFTNADGSGTIQYYAATNLAPALWSGHKITLTSATSTNTISLTSANSFTSTIPAVTGSAAGTYLVNAKTPVDGWLELIQADGVIYYLQLHFSTISAGDYLAESPAVAGSVSFQQRGTFKWK